MPSPTSSPSTLSRLLAQLFLRLLPSVFLGILGLCLSELARLFNLVARLCHPGAAPPLFSPPRHTVHRRSRSRSRSPSPCPSPSQSRIHSPSRIPSRSLSPRRSLPLTPTSHTLLSTSSHQCNSTTSPFIHPHTSPTPIPSPPLRSLHSRSPVSLLGPPLGPPLSPILRPPPAPPSAPPSAPLPVTLVAKRVYEYENFLAGTNQHLDHPIRPPFPTQQPPLVLSAIDTDTDNDNNTAVASSDLDTDKRKLHPSINDSASEASDTPPMQSGGKSCDVQTFVAATDSSDDESQISTPEAPPARESLQELIPDGVPVPTFPSLSMDDDGAVTLVEDSMEKIPSLFLPGQGSDASLRTESYSSPDSPIQITTPAKHRKSWRNSDHDLFSEDPIMTFDNIDDTPRLGEQEKHSNSKDPSSKGDSVLTEEYTSSNLIVSIQSAPSRRSFSFEEDMRVAQAIPSSRQHSKSVQLPAKSEKEHRRTSRNFIGMRVVPENRLFRQASADVASINTATFLNDRPRPGSAEPSRLIPNRWGDLRLSRSPSSGKRIPRMMRMQNVSRSQSTTDRRFEDWPEYTPSSENDSPKLSRRHASDMSYGVKDRKQDMLPEELLDETEGGDDFGHGVGTVFNKFGGRALKRFCRHSLTRDDGKGHVRNFLRRRKRGTGLEEGTASALDGGHSFHQASHQNVASGRDRDYKFESELDQDTVFSLLDRLCPECGYDVAIRRPTHKLKIAVSSDTTGPAPMLLSVSLIRVANGRNTLVSISRSKDDSSKGATARIEAVGAQLQKRLASQVEFIEDSFASLYFDESSSQAARGMSAGE